MAGGRILNGLASLAMLTMLWCDAGSLAAAPASDTEADDGAFLGRWDLTLKTPERDYASWLEITRGDDKLQARMVSRWGHARWLPEVKIADGRLRFVSPKEEEGRTDTDMIFEGGLVGRSLVGNTSGPDGTVWTWRGERAPTLNRLRPVRWGEPQALFNGRDLDGWRMSDADATPAWQVRDGTLVSPGRGPDLVSSTQYEDFMLHVEFNCAPGANSGVYLRGRYEVQIEDDPGSEPADWRTGSIYGFLEPAQPMPQEPAAWHAFDLTFIGRRVTVVLDGRTLIAGQEIPGITGGALDSHEGLPGPIYLQGSEDGHVAFRNIVVRPAQTSGKE